jgi:hypothetical protein
METCGFFSNGHWLHPIIEGEYEGWSRWGRQFWGLLVAGNNTHLQICINGNLVVYAKADLLWWGTRWAGGPRDNEPAAHPDGFKYPAAFPQIPELRNSPISGGINGKGRI